MSKITLQSKRVAYSPQEFAEFFGREKTWTYRQLYQGKLKSIRGHGKQLIPASEIDRYLEEAKEFN